MILSIALMTGLMLLALGLILWPMAQRQLLSAQRLIALVVILPSMAIALYALLGTPQLIMQHAVPQAQSAQMTELIDRLAARLTQQPDDLAGWQLLANSYLVNGQLAQAEHALDTALTLAPQEVDLILAWLDVVSSIQPTAYPPIAAERIAAGLAKEADNPLLLWFALQWETQTGNMEKVAEYYVKLQRHIPDQMTLHPQALPQLPARQE